MLGWLQLQWQPEPSSRSLVQVCAGVSGDHRACGAVAGLQGAGAQLSIATAEHPCPGLPGSGAPWARAQQPAARTPTECGLCGLATEQRVPSPRISSPLCTVDTILWGELLTRSCQVAFARREYGVAYPAMYAEGDSEGARTFNCVQRAHQNALETMPLVGSCVGGFVRGRVVG